jgi:hypothetical protein
MTSDNSIFSSRTVFLLIVIGTLAFAGAAYFMVFGDEGRPSGANSFSKSAIGHKAFLELLKRQDTPVIVSRSDSANKTGDDSLLVIAEPLTSEIAKFGGIPRANRTLLVLPKWQGLAASDRPEWISQVALLSQDAVNKTLKTALPNASIVRPLRVASWNNVPLATLYVFRPSRLENDLLWSRMRSRAAPDIDTLQLIRSSRLTPIISSPNGILVGGLKSGDQWLFVISDPDLLSNHGIGRSDNASLLLDLFPLFKPDSGQIVIDETMHGFHSNPDLWRKLFEFPFIMPTILTLAAIIVLLWASASRFGAPLPPEGRNSKDESGLIESAVDLLHQAGHGTEIAKRYPAVVLREVLQRLHVPRRLSGQERLTWVDRVGAARSVETTYSKLQAEIETASSKRSAGGEGALSAVTRLYQWKQEMLNGSGRDKSD